MAFLRGLPAGGGGGVAEFDQVDTESARLLFRPSYQIVSDFGNSFTPPTSGTAYFAYIGKLTKNLTFSSIFFNVAIGGGGAQTAEVGLFASVSAPTAGDLSLTKLGATGSIDSLLSTGIMRNSVDLATAVVSGTFLWVGLRIVMGASQPSIYTIGGSPTNKVKLGGHTLRLAGSSPLTDPGPFAAVYTDTDFGFRFIVSAGPY